MKNSLIFLISVLTLCSCSKEGDYVDAIPSTAMALVAIDGRTPLLSDIDDIDTTKTVYLFELAGGEMGLCAMNTDGNPMIEFLSSGDSDTQTGTDEEHQEKLLRLMQHYDSENSIRHSELWKHLNETKQQNPNYRMWLVAQSNVLPKQMQACLLLGAPKGTDPADILLETGLTYIKDDADDNTKGTLTLQGHTCAFDQMREQVVKHAFFLFKPITIDWQSMMNDSTGSKGNLLGVFMNIDGKDFVPMLQQNKALNMMLMGSNAIDRIQSNKGNMAILGTIDNHWSVETNVSNAKQDQNKKAKLIVCLNMQSLPKGLAQTIGFLTKKINRIVYTVE